MPPESSLPIDASDEPQPGTDSRPWSERITRWDVLCVGPLAVINLYIFLGRFLTAPLVADHPVLLEFLRGSISAMVSAGASAHLGRVPLWLVLVAPLPIQMAADPFLYWVGRRYGRRLLDWLAANDPGWKRRLPRAERFYRRWGAWTIVFGQLLPASVFFFVAAGEVGMNFGVFLAADLLGTLLWTSLNIGLGYVFYHQASAIAAAVSHYAWWITGGLLVVVVVVSVYRSWRLHPREHPGDRVS